MRSGVRIVVPGGNAQDRFAADDLRKGLRARGVRIGSSSAALRIDLLRDNSPLARDVLRRAHETLDPAMDPEGYVLITERHQAFVIGHTAAGVFYGAQTLKQLVRTGGTGPILQGAVIRDWPAMRWRGVHDDLSR
ncbi:MAG: glycoside hydrolase family 20 zincin-like fold domain-containing protein, partial [Acidobacteriaceae bacterium]